MQAHELRKLITTFLVLALLAGSASLAFTSIARQKGEGPVAATKQAQVPKIGDKAFVEDIATTRIEGYDLAAEFTPHADPTDNYTDNLAKSLAYDFVKANPEGPDLSAGTGILVPQNLDETAQRYITEAALTPTTYAIDSSRLRIARNYTPAQLTGYVESINETIGHLNGDQGIAGIRKRIGTGDMDEQSVMATNFLYADTQSKLYAMTVPAPAEKLHRALLTSLELSRKLSDLDYNTDPLKAVVFIEKYPALQDRETQNLQLAFAEFQQQVPKLLSQRNPFPITRLLSPSMALAQVGPTPTVEQPGPLITATGKILGTMVADLKADVNTSLQTTGSHTQQLFEWARKLALSILRNQIVGRLIQQTIKWVQGGGKPQFITNWKGFLKDSAIGAANEFLSTVTPRLCGNLRAFTSDYLKASVPNTVSGSRDQYRQFNCTLDQIVSSVKDFYNDFTSGGWLGLATLVLAPQNNPWGAVIVAHDAAIQKSTEAQAAADANAQANRGFKGFTRCVKETTRSGLSRSEAEALKQDPNFIGLSCSYATGNGGGSDPGEYAYCMNNPDEMFTPGGSLCSEVIAAGPPILSQTEQCEVKLCSSDGIQQITPGGAVADQLSDALGGTLNSVVNAQDLEGLVAAVIDSAINRLLNFAVGGILGLFNDSGSGGDGGGTGGGDTGGTGGGGGTSGIDSLRARALDLASTYQDNATAAQTDNAAWPNLASSTQPLLASVVSTCTDLAEDANQRLDAIGRIAVTVSADGGRLGDLLAEVASTTDAIRASSDPVEIADLLASLDPINSGIMTVATRVTARNSQMQALNQDAQDNLRNRSCSTPLTPLDE